RRSMRPDGVASAANLPLMFGSQEVAYGLDLVGGMCVPAGRSGGPDDFRAHRHGGETRGMSDHGRPSCPQHGARGGKLGRLLDNLRDRCAAQSILIEGSPLQAGFFIVAT